MSKIEDFGVHANQYYALEVCMTSRQAYTSVAWCTLTHAHAAAVTLNEACHWRQDGGDNSGVRSLCVGEVDTASRMEAPPNTWASL